MAKLYHAVIPLVFITLIGIQVPQWFQRWQQEGTIANPFRTLTLDGNTETLLHDNKPALLIFWATWCTPCHIEMARLKSAVLEGTLPADRIFAISIDGHIDAVKQFLKQTPYPFQIRYDQFSEGRRAFQIEVTPTLVYVKSNRNIQTLSAGIGPLTIQRAKSLFKQD